MMYDPDFHESFKATKIPTNRRGDPGTVRRTGIVQIVFGVVMFILGAAAFGAGMAGLVEPVYSSIGAGMWCGIIVVSAGSIGVMAARRVTQAWNIASLVMACASTICCVIFLVISAASLNAELNPGMGNRTQNATDASRSFTTPATSTQNATLTPGENENRGTDLVVDDALGIIVALATLVTAVIQAISSYQMESFGLSTMIFVIGRSLMGCCCRNQFEESTAGYAREEDFSANDPYGDLGT